MSFNIDLGDAEAIVAMVAIIAGGFIAVTKYVVRNEIHSALSPATAAARVQFAELRSDVDEIRAEFQPNGGESMRDRLVRLETSVNVIKEQIP